MVRRSSFIAVFSASLVLVACGDIPLPPLESDCLPGETKCDGIQLVTCRQQADGSVKWDTPEPCPSGGECRDGVCLATECGSCDQPPGSCYQSPGTCQNGSCLYAPEPDGTACDDGDPCTVDDDCESGACAGRPMACDAPPPNSCQDEATLTVYSPIGICSGGLCSYPASDISCPMGCASGSCTGDPCLDVVCDQAPNSCFLPGGFCSNGQCFYIYDDGKTCDDADACTINDECVGGKCVGTPKLCTTPPPPVCANSTTLTVYENQGTCVGGTCSYPPKTVTCSHGCVAGACQTDPCGSVSCDSPPSSCYVTPGTCQDGQCTYLPDDGKVCDDGDPCTKTDTCNSGSCKGSPVLCNTPPSSSCTNSTTLTVYTAPGTCTNGTCVYGSADVSCPFGCDPTNAVCMGDPCASISCNSPPNTQCYSVPGICSAGTCTYLAKSGESCNDNNACTYNDTCNSSGQCTGTAYSCNDNLTCTSDSCTGTGTCTHTLQSGYCLIIASLKKTCFQSGALNPDNACQYCSPSVSTSVWQPVNGNAMITWNFNTGVLGGFAVTPNPATSPVKWQVDDQRAVSGTYSLYFGDVATHTYDDPDEIVFGEVTSPSVALPASSGKLCLKFQLFMDTEMSTLYDQLWADIVGVSSPIWESRNEANYGDTGGQFRPIAVDVSSKAGSTVQFRFSFDSVDEILNDYEGIYLDDIQVLTNCSP